MSARLATSMGDAECRPVKLTVRFIRRHHSHFMTLRMPLDFRTADLTLLCRTILLRAFTESTMWHSYPCLKHLSHLPVGFTKVH